MIIAILDQLLPVLLRFTAITQDVYMAKNTGGKRAAAALDALIAP